MNADTSDPEAAGTTSKAGLPSHNVYCCIDPGVRDEPHPDCPGFNAVLAAMAPRTVTITIPVLSQSCPLCRPGFSFTGPHIHERLGG